MSYNGYEFYDVDANFDNYMERRKGKENANDTLEKPVICELLGEVNCKKTLDLGCGDARFAKELFDLGCEQYIGIEGSSNMVERASTFLVGQQGKVIQTSIEGWDYPEDTFNLVVSRLAIHYIEDIDSMFLKIYKTLTSSGSFIFSIEHPVITSTLQPSGIRTNWIVDNYFKDGFREQQWLGGTVHKYHRSIEDYFRALQRAGFSVEHLRESTPRREHFENEATYERRLKIPLFLSLSARK
ncbi:class I SAM-dependent methyltransferase [Paenibacillus sp. L3-i20]|uniref:class I SAM-dependent DNA methyltransferase n=1 Tax=Paenibacillus sp. L3-i20 TaxID=2905833 RepID=UPI001EDFC65F|nr:class I SAM-dependent methyltransferase [Paenibacillus sp. L3-i20]GKU78419.1 methyltransferase [Paenibacillus sp. L3-i20]